MDAKTGFKITGEEDIHTVPRVSLHKLLINHKTKNVPYLLNQVGQNDSNCFLTYLPKMFNLIRKKQCDEIQITNGIPSGQVD